MCRMLAYAGPPVLLDDLLVERPGNAAILNSRCWIKGTRNVELESALKDCTTTRSSRLMRLSPWRLAKRRPSSPITSGMW